MVLDAQSDKVGREQRLSVKEDQKVRLHINTCADITFTNTPDYAAREPGA